MSRKYPYGGGKQHRAHLARVKSIRYDAWANAHPEQAKEQLLKYLGLSPEIIERSMRVPPVVPDQIKVPQIQTAKHVNVAHSVSGAVASGVVAGGAFSVTQNLHQVFTGKKDFDLAAKDVAIDMLTAGASSAAITGTAEGIKYVAKMAMPNVAKSIVKGSAPVVIASGVVELAVDAYKGDLTTKSATLTAARTAGGWAGAELGAVSGLAAGTALAPFTAGLSIPVLGFFGGMAGGIAGAFGGGKLAEKAFAW